MADAFREACAVQNRLNERYASEPWFRGVGLGKGSENGTFAVEVLVCNNAKRVKLPSEVDGIEVRAIATGPIRVN